MPTLNTPIPAGAPPVPKSIQLRDWTGGLNLRGDAMQLSLDETPSILDLDIHAEGGVQRRATVRTASTTAWGSNAPALLTQFVGNGVKQWLVGNQDSAVDKIRYYTALGTAGTLSASLGGTSVTAAWRSASMARAATASSERLYVQRDAQNVAFKWNGTAATNLGDAVGNYNDNVAAPAGGFMPKAKLICTHLSYMFHGDILEASRFANRIRWSHAGQPEDYQTNDFINVADGEDGDGLTGIASHEGALYLFKDRSTWILTGFDADTFALKKIADVGAVSQEAIAVGTYGLVAYDSRLGIHAFSPTGGAPLWGKLIPHPTAATTDAVQAAYVSKIVCGWIGSRLYVSVPWGAGAAINNRTFVFDPFVGKRGAWWMYGLGFSRLLEYRAPSVSTIKLGCQAGNPTYLHQIDAGLTTDRLDGATETTFEAHIYTVWLDAGVPSLKKRWRRFSLTFDQQLPTDTMRVSVWKNWSLSGVARTFNLAGNAVAGTMVWGDDWGETWSGAVVADQISVRAGTIGTAYSVGAKVTGPNNKSWGLNEISFRFVPGRIS